jgi:hypothetical protein
MEELKRGSFNATMNEAEMNVYLTRPQSMIPGDINLDNVVDIYDALLLAAAFRSTPADPNWNINADLNTDNVIDIFDAIILANHYNQHYP